MESNGSETSQEEYYKYQKQQMMLNIKKNVAPPKRSSAIRAAYNRHDQFNQITNALQRSRPSNIQRSGSRSMQKPMIEMQDFELPIVQNYLKKIEYELAPSNQPNSDENFTDDDERHQKSYVTPKNRMDNKTKEVFPQSLPSSAGITTLHDYEKEDTKMGKKSQRTMSRLQLINKTIEKKQPIELELDTNEQRLKRQKSPTPDISLTPTKQDMLQIVQQDLRGKVSKKKFTYNTNYSEIKTYDSEQKNKKLIGIDSLNDQKKMNYKSMGACLSMNDIKNHDKNEGNSQKQPILSRSKRFSNADLKNNTENNLEKTDMRKIFIESYGIELDFGGFYYSDSKFVPNHEEYIITACWHIVPNGESKIVQTTYNDNTFKEQKYEDLYTTRGSDIILQLMKPLKTGKFENLKEIQIKGVKQCIIQFSKRGTLFGIYDSIKHELKIYNSRDINTCMLLIENDITLYKFEIEDKSFMATSIIFDQRDRYVAVVSSTQIIFFSVYEDNVIKKVGKYSISENYEEILDTIIDSKNAEENRPFKCMIACKQDGGRRIIEIFDIYSNPQDRNDVRSILYQELGNSLMVKISDDFNQVVFSNGEEHYILKGESQDFFPQIGQKTIRKCIVHENIFYFVSSNKLYDRDLIIQCSQDRKFKRKILRSIEPESIKVFDSEIQYSDIQDNCRVMRIIMNHGDYLYLDTIEVNFDSIEESNTPEKPIKQEQLNQNVTVCEQMYMAYSFNWPYFSYSTKFNYVFILNAFNPYFVQRYETPVRIIRIMKTFLTDTHDLFIICETKVGLEMFNIDLDSPKPFLEGPLFQYTFKEVNYQTLTDFHVRASSRKEKINLNKACIAFMMHGNVLFGWCQGNGDTIKPVNYFSLDIRKKEVTCSNYYYLSDDIIFYMVTEIKQFCNNKVCHSKIVMVEAQFGTYKVTDIYEDKDQRAEILNFGVDNTLKRLIILTRVKNPKGKCDKFFTLFSFVRNKVIIQKMIKNQEIIGRLKSNLYNFVGGHIYYNNKVIKIRYDLIEGAGGAKNKNAILDIEENQLFDAYSEILFLQPDDRIQAGTPLQTCLYNRLAYVIQNQEQLKPRRVLILPYLHERKIYLNRQHKSNQFYTLVKHQNNQSYIICLCVAENKMYVYTENGILIGRVSYQDLADKYGKPISISENGLILIFKKGNDSPEIHLIFIHINKLEWVESINIQERLDSYFEKFKKSFEDKNEELDSKSKDKFQFYKLYLHQMKDMKSINLDFWLNDDSEVLIRIKPSKSGYDHIEEHHQQDGNEQHSHDDEEEFEDVQDQKQNPEFLKRSFFFFFPNPALNEVKNNCKYCFGCSLLGRAIENQVSVDEIENQVPSSEEFIYYDSNDDEIYDLKGVSMNQDYIFFWNNGKVWKLEMKTQELSEVGLYVDERQEETFVRQVRTGSDKNKVSIRVRQTDTMDCVIIWNLEKDIEIDSFDVQKNAVFFQDRLGNGYLVENDYIINCDRGCKLMSYQFQVSDFEEPQFGFGNGYRVDDEMHNFILMRNYINLSFSYMTFIIKMNYDNGGYINEDFQFDVEGYDYILKKNSVFTEGTLVISDYDKLLFILQKYEMINPILIEQLFYRNEQNKTPLHIAVGVNNTRIVNLLLDFMSRMQNSGITIIKDIFKDLITYSQFSNYLNKSPFQSVQMINKQTLIIAGSDTDEIIKLCPSKSSYVDEDYFEDVMGEDHHNPEFKTYGVNMCCIRADWILNEEAGLDFLKAMLREKNREVFVSSYMKIIIQFLYDAYSRKIIIWLLPPYLAHLIAINIQIFSNEKMRTMREDIDNMKGNVSDEILFEFSKAKLTSNMVVTICGIISFINMIVFAFQTRSLGLTAFTRIWSIVDFLIILTNTTTWINQYYKIGTRYIRFVECTLILAMWFKSMYYMRLLQQIAPLVESIFVILNDMMYFLLVFCIGILAFAQAFFILGQNQVMIARQEAVGITDHADQFHAVIIPSYYTFFGAFFHAYMSALGQLDISEYQDNDMTIALMFLFTLMSFFMCIHLLNMLIAIMGESFSKNAEIAESNRKISQLEFVINNWWIHPIQEKHNIVYFISAFAVSEDDKKEDKIDILEQQMSDMSKILVNLYKQQNEMQYTISQFNLQKD